MTRRHLGIAGTGLAFALCGCPGSDDGGGTGDSGSSGSESSSTATTSTASATSSTTGTASSTTATTTASTSNGSVDDSSGSASAEGSTSDATATDGTTDATATDGTSAGDSTGGSGTTGAGACDPPGDPCGDCVAEHCCNHIEDCNADPDCACMAQCLDGGGDFGQCLGDCMLQNPPMDLMLLFECTNNNCAGVCG